MMTFDEWIKAVFDHPVTDQHWSFQEDDSYVLWDFYANQPQRCAEYIARTFEEIARFPDHYSDGQIAAGLKYIVEPSFSSVAFNVVDLDKPVDMTTRLRCIAAIYTVYEQLFAVRCTSQVARLVDETIERNPLNYICFMWWDVFPTHGHPDQPEYAELDQAILDVITRTLSIDSEACQEAALHGLSEWHYRYPRTVMEIGKRFLAENPQITPELRAYGEKAYWGGVQ